MTYTKSSAITPFSFGQLSIRELTPTSLQAASVAEIAIPPGARHGRARSTRSHKIYTCLEGVVEFELAGEQITFRPLDVLHIPTGQWFDYHNRSHASARLLLVHVPPFDLGSEEFHADEG